jgi:hypothetical protein
MVGTSRKFFVFDLEGERQCDLEIELSLGGHSHAEDAQCSQQHDAFAHIASLSQWL